MSWSPDQYARFRAEREAPFLDIVALAELRPSFSIVDLGCGTGELTARLAALSPGSETVGVDASEEMLARARPLERPGLRFELGTIEAWEPTRPFDVVFSHAALQWVDEHPSLLARLARALAPGGQLLVQMPSNQGHVSHVTVRELAGTSPWRERLSGFVRISPVLAIDAYAELLHALGLERVAAIERVYGHLVDGPRGVLEWLKGTLLVPYRERLGEHAHAFEEALLAELARRIPDEPYYFAYRRTLLAARRPG